MDSRIFRGRKSTIAETIRDLLASCFFESTDEERSDVNQFVSTIYYLEGSGNTPIYSTNISTRQKKSGSTVFMADRRAKELVGEESVRVYVMKFLRPQIRGVQQDSRERLKEILGLTPFDSSPLTDLHALYDTLASRVQQTELSKRTRDGFLGQPLFSSGGRPVFIVAGRGPILPKGT